MILGGMNEGVWPSLPKPRSVAGPADPARRWACRALEFRTGLAAHDFMSALGAPRVLLTRARRDSRSPTVASRLWLQAAGDDRRNDPRPAARAAGDRRSTQARRSNPATRPAPRPPVEARPKKIAVTDLDRLKADPFAFYAKAILRLRPRRAGRCRASCRLEGHRGPRGAGGMVQAGRLRSGQAQGEGRGDDCRRGASTPCSARSGRRG